MNEVIYQGTRYVVSRQRGVISELVDGDGRILRLPTVEVPTPTYVWRGVVPGSARFSDRPRDFLSILRTRRDIDLAARLKAKRSAAAKSTREKGLTSTVQKRVPTGAKAIQSVMNAMSPAIAAMMAQQLAGLSKKKPSKKGTGNA